MEEKIGENTVLVPGDSGKLVVVFGSYASMFTKTYEGYDFFSQRGDNALFFRDASPLAYHDGFTGLTSSVEENVEFLKVMKRRLGAERVTFVGISSGGYAAILLGALMGIDDVIAINPVTYWDKDIAAEKGVGPRFANTFQNFYDFYGQMGQDPRYLDLTKVLADHPTGIKLIGLHYGVEDEIDVTNAQHLADAAQVEMVPHSCPMHALLAANMIEQGVMDHHLNTDLDQLREDYRAFS